MGIPKFFRYIAQRWPLASQEVNGNVIPEFDNLYLDMNSIIHMSTHANAENVGHLDENLVFLQICNYIEHLFTVISPQKVFMMAIDGVAPRAKMNQQRARRFRSALDAEKARQSAAAKGEVLDEDPFDSNCITPGTEFMAHLTTYLKYFIARKITEDKKWQQCQIVLSGHEVPGEGEHKIMNFIRQLRSQPSYTVNTRHCLYGLDADLIMLGLSTHEPHFSLLREEVTFGRKIAFQSRELSEQKFILLHMSIVREYIQLEMMNGDFVVQPDFERVLDDVILILFFIGNDFLPELPMLLVNDGAIPVIFDTYKQYLNATSSHYISTNGKIDFMALKNWMEYLKSYQIRKFEQQSNVDGWLSAQMDKVKESQADELVLTVPQRDVFEYARKYLKRCISKDDRVTELEIKTEPKFVKLLAEQTGFDYVDGVLKYTASVEPKQALKTLRIYAVAKVDDPHAKEEYGAKLTEWKNRYYRAKFQDTYDSDVVKQTSKRYLEGLQWVLFYYYRSCPSWGWYFDNHYSTMTTELIDAIGDGFQPEFDLGTPFTPFEQLMSVLPDRSVKLLPKPLHHLVLEPTSPIIDFYPHSFELDKNGKKADWEAVVLIPFIDEKRLLQYVKPVEAELSDYEKFRNSSGKEIEFTFDPSHPHLYKSPNTVETDIHECTCRAEPLAFETNELRYGLLSGSLTGRSALAGFPSLYTLPFDWELDNNVGVKVFEMPSRDDSVIIKPKPQQNRLKTGQHVFVNWPFLREAEVTRIRSPDTSALFTKIVPRTVSDLRRVGVDIGKTEAVVCVRMLQGLQRMPDGSFVKDFGSPKDQDISVPAQIVVTNVENHDPRFVERRSQPIEKEFPLHSHALVLLQKFYGMPAEIVGFQDGDKVDVEVLRQRGTDNVKTVSGAVAEQERRAVKWLSLNSVAKILKIDIRTLLNLTGRVSVDVDGKRLNVGLTLRVPNLNLKAEGYSDLDHTRQVLFSQAAVELLKQYLQAFHKELLPILSRKHNSNPKIDGALADRIRAWQSTYFAAPVYIPVTTQRLSPWSCRAIEQSLLSQGEIHLEKAVITGLERAAVLASSSAHHQLRSQKFHLGDRVVFALDHGKVPQFARGVVLGVSGTSAENTMLDVAFDFEFPAGNTLDDRLTSKRGLTVPAQSVLNIGQPQLKFVTGRVPRIEHISATVDSKWFHGKSGRPENVKKEKEERYVPAPVVDEWAAQASVPVIVQAPKSHPKGPKGKKVSQEPKESKASKEPKEPKQPKQPKQQQPKEPKQPNKPKEPKEHEEHKEPKKLKEPKEQKQPKSSQSNLPKEPKTSSVPPSHDAGLENPVPEISKLLLQTRRTQTSANAKILLAKMKNN